MAGLELLAPAGDWEKLESALHFGADAVYLAGERFGLRSASKNFSKDQLEKALDFAHSLGKKVYVTLNIIAHNADFLGLGDYIRFLDRAGADGVIVADPGIFSLVKENSNLPIHVSTQANVTNEAAAKFWALQGASRIVLARELSLEEIRAIRLQVPKDLELEAFVHGAMCISYSGRCLLSSYLTGRDSNRGDCAQACRWKYHLLEETRPGQYLEISEDERGTFLLNSKDLCLLPYLSDLIQAGVTSFKIEGRVKTPYYVSTVVHAYRKALDAIEEGSLAPSLVADLLGELKKTSHRSFTTGFLYGNPGREGQNYASTSYVQDYLFIGRVQGQEEGQAWIEVRNKFAKGEEVEILRSQGPALRFTIQEIWDADGEAIQEVRTPKSLVRLPLSAPVSKGDILRRKK